MQSGPESRVERFFDALFARDGAGGSWLGALLRAAPAGRTRLGELVDAPGWLQAPLAVHTETGRRGAFEYPAAPTRQLLGWFIDHPDELTWVELPESTPETVRLRRALVDDDPHGVRVRAQDRAHDLLRRSSPLGHAWWRFEETHRSDCVLITDRLVVVVQAREGTGTAPATPWFPRRSTFVRELEAARRFADGKPYGLLTLADEVGARDGQPALDAVRQGAPHLDEAAQQELAAAYLGELSWAEAAAATGLAP